MKFRTFTLIGLTLLMFVLSACTGQPAAPANFANIPAGRAYADGKEIYFSHTETSDPDVAEKLSGMMKSPVLLVPALAKVPEEATSAVYVFENGLAGKGPLGFQPDVFDNPAGTPGYTPLRRIVLTKWNDAGKARELKAASEILSAEKSGELILTKTNIVVNMPFMVWEGGKR